MKMHKSAAIAYLVIFIVFLLLPVPLWQAAKAAGAADALDAANYENREEAARPSLTRETVNTFPTEYEAWFNENLPFRSRLLTARGALDYYVLHSTNTTSILVGRDGWLYYSGSQANGEDPIADYKGTNAFSDEELSKIWMQLKSAQMMCEYMGKQFVVEVIPSKERVYADHMPLTYGKANDGRLQQVTEYLTSQDIDVVNPYENLLAYREAHPEREEQLYRTYDTHWNRLGAYIAARGFDAYLGVHNLPALEDTGREPAPRQNYDLARLLHLGDVLTDDSETEPTGYGDTSGITCEINDTATEYVYNNSADDVDPRRILIIGDSFSPIMTDYIASDFRYVAMTYYYAFTPDMLQSMNPDVVVYEVNERYLMNLERFTLQDIMPIVQATYDPNGS